MQRFEGKASLWARAEMGGTDAAIARSKAGRRALMGASSVVPEKIMRP
jgi:hypothetical protein